MAENKLWKPVAYFLGGAALGAGLGILLAPKSGERTRADLAEWLKSKREKGRALMSKVREEIPAKKEQVAAAFRAGKEAYREAEHAKKEPVGV